MNNPQLYGFLRKRHVQTQQPVGDNRRRRGTHGVNRVPASTENRVPRRCNRLPLAQDERAEAVQTALPKGGMFGG